MKALSNDLRRRIVNHYKAVRGATCASTAAHFSVGDATVSRLLRLDRETGDLVSIAEPKPRELKVDLDWLRQHAVRAPDAFLKDRVVDYLEERGVRVCITSMWTAMNALGWTHKKRPSSPASARRRAFRS